MDIRLEHTALQLAERSTISVVDGKGARIAVTEGSVWITQERDTRDVTLEDGESFRFDCDGLALISAFGLALISISRS